VTLNEPVAEELIEIRSIKPAVVSVRTCKKSSEHLAIKELAASIRQHGLIQPITIRPIDSGFEIVAGHRRFLACKLLRWRVIPSIVRCLSDKDAFELQLVENMHRRTMDPLEEAESFKKYVLDYGWGGVSQLAHVISKSEQYVSGRIQLLRLPKEIIDDILQNKLTVSHAVELVNLNEHDQRVVTTAIINKKLSVQSVRGIVRCAKHGEELEEMVNYAISDNYDESTRTYNSSRSNIHQIRLLKKTLLSLRISLARLDSLIEEANGKLYADERTEFISRLMQFRLKIHSMIDENIKAIANLKKTEITFVQPVVIAILLLGNGANTLSL
jgi:ParB family chromosome partitioning protein